MKITYKSAGGVDIEFEDTDSTTERKLMLSAVDLALRTIQLSKES